MVGRAGVDKSDGIRFGRLQAARRVEAMDGFHQPATLAILQGLHTGSLMSAWKMLKVGGPCRGRQIWRDQIWTAASRPQGGSHGWLPSAYDLGNPL